MTRWLAATPLSERARIVILLVVISLPLDVLMAHIARSPQNDLRFGDFLGFWSYGRLVAQHHAGLIYRAQAIEAVQHALQPGLVGSLPFFYPPPMMFLVAPLGGLPQAVAYLAWEVAGVAALLVAAFASPCRPRAAALFLVLPGTVMAVLFGQSGFLVGAFALGGLRLVPTRPILGGILLGLVIVKPQLGLLVPVALVAAGERRALAAAAASACAVALLSGLCFGWRIWIDWLHILPLAEGQWHYDIATRFRFSPTPQASLLMMGAPVPLLRSVQLGCLALCVALIWRTARTGLDERAIVVTLGAVFLASPYATVYDLPAFNAALLLFFCRHEGGTGERFAALGAQALPTMALLGTVPLAMPALILALLLAFAAPRLRVQVAASSPGVAPSAHHLALSDN